MSRRSSVNGGHLLTDIGYGRPLTDVCRRRRTSDVGGRLQVADADGRGRTPAGRLQVADAVGRWRTPALSSLCRRLCRRPNLCRTLRRCPIFISPPSPSYPKLLHQRRHPRRPIIGRPTDGHGGVYWVLQHCCRPIIKMLPAWASTEHANACAGVCMYLDTFGMDVRTQTQMQVDCLLTYADGRLLTSATYAYSPATADVSNGPL